MMDSDEILALAQDIFTEAVSERLEEFTDFDGVAQLSVEAAIAFSNAVDRIETSE